ncbi:hypothetical protein GS605_16985 [Ruegeria sp. HKCCD7559]|nr:hypothetical protein [Ruegeria sp. HKCCD7559]
MDGAGITVLGTGAWQARQHGVLQGPVGFAMDAATSDIRAVKLSPSRDSEGPAALLRNETLHVA